MTSPRIGYIGLGALGSAIFPNIVGFAEHNSLPAPAVWNRSQDKYAAVKEAHPNVYTATEVEELVPRCDLIFTCLVNDAAAEEVYGKLVAALQKEKVREGGNKVFADQTTLKASTALRIRDLVKSAGATYLTTTVFGQPPAAKARQLVCISSGDAEGRKVVLPVLEYIGKKVIDVGDDNAKGAALKLLGNGTLLGAIQLYSEMYALADRIGFDSATFYELHQSLFPAPALLNYSNKISQGAFGGAAGFTVNNGLKDAGHVLSLGEDFGQPTPVPTIERAKQSLLRAKELGADGLDWAALAVTARVEAGLEPFKEGTDNGKKAPVQK